MDKKQKLRKVIYRGCFLLFAAAVWAAVRPDSGFFLGSARAAVYNTCLPALSFAEKGQKEEDRQEEGILQQESGSVLREILQAEGRSEDEESETGAALEIQQGDTTGKIRVTQDLEKGLQEENKSFGETASGNGLAESTEETQPETDGEETQTAFDDGFLKQESKVQSYEWDYYSSYEPLVKEFYAIDRSTAIGDDRLNLENLMGRDLKIQAGTEAPQILIYHTHSQEIFADSVPGDTGTSIVGVGEHLTQILREEYGFNVLHHTGEYDVESRDFAYTNALPAIEQVLAENPGIEVIIDLHRDACAQDTHLVMDLNGRPTARFMFFNGLSSLKKTGDIESLPNPYIDDNLAFAFQMQVLCNEYYPGLTRRIYLKGYRYNMHLRPKSLLIELGAQTNTVEEAMNACDPLAQMLALELRGEGMEGD